MTAEPAASAPFGSITAANLTKSFYDPEGGRQCVLDDIELDVGSAEFLSIVGPSGCGKTTLLRILKGLDGCDEGTVRIDGVSAPDAHSAFVFQAASLLPWRTVGENVAFGLEMTWIGRHEGIGRRRRRELSEERVGELLELTNLSDYKDYYPGQISGGMQQRANLARALAVQPSVLLMDEPFSALDAQTKERLQRDLQSIVHRVGITTVFITHDIREAVFQSDRVMVMSARPGRIKSSFNIDVPRPRGAEFQQSDELNSLSRQVWEELHAASDVL